MRDVAAQSGDAVLVNQVFAYIDAKGNIRGEFGPSYEWQQAQPVPPPIEPTE